MAREWAPYQLVFLAVLALGVANTAFADDTHYQDYIVGGRAAGLAGAFTSLSDDPSGIFYNPAGLADVRHADLQFSASLYGFEQNVVNQPPNLLPVSGLSNLNVEFTNMLIVPASAGFVSAFGSEGQDGLPQQAYGATIVVPSSRSLAINSANATPLGVATTYSQNMTDRSLWCGAGYGRKLGERLRLGISGFYILRSMTDVENVASNSTSSDPSLQGFQNTTNNVSLLNGNLVFEAGAKYRLDDHFTAGLSITSPSIAINSHAQLQFTEAQSNPACTGSQCPFGNSPSSTLQTTTFNAHSATHYPTTIRAGLSYVERYKFTIAADATYNFPVHYSLIYGGGIDQSLTDRLPFPATVDRKGVLNFNVGAEFLIIREVSVAGGVFSDYSSAPSIPANPGQTMLPHVNLLGGSIALGYFGEHSISRLGILYSAGSGEDVVPSQEIAPSAGPKQPVQRAPYAQSFFYVFVSSTFRY